MPEIQITDLVPQETLDRLRELDREMQTVVDTYTNTARELARGIRVEVKVIGDLDKLNELQATNLRQVEENTRRLNQVTQERNTIVANTTNTISRALMEQERLNKQVREEYTGYERAKQIVTDYYGSLDEQTKRLARLNQLMKENSDKQKENTKNYEKGAIAEEEFLRAQGSLQAEYQKLKVSRSSLQRDLTAEIKMMQAGIGSYDEMSQTLELLKKAYKNLNEEMQGTEYAREMETAIQELDAHLKDAAADMGEFQRNVGNYAIAGQNGVVATESVIAALQQEALTTQDLIDQTKILEEAKVRLDTNDADYAATLAALNAKIDENKAKLMDVSDIMAKDATSAAEAEAQNKRLQEAMKHVDTTADGAQQRIDELNAKIERNNQVIERAIPTTERLARKQKELADAAREAGKEAETSRKANEGAANQLLSLMGINANFGSSLQKLGESGNVFEGLKTKVGAFGKTLTGLLANPWVLTFLGITGVAAGFKWWYDYNKGLIEASRLTKMMTGLAGEAADKVTADMQTLADHTGKGYKETLDGANQLVMQFGVSWSDAAKLMHDGIVAGADASGKMLENINKYAGAFKDAGIEADQFMAILANTKDGLFNEKALKSITDAGTRIRSMSKNAKSAIDGIGISADKMKKDLASGTITMVEAIQQITDKMSQLSPNSQEVGEVMKNVFGRKAAMAGEETLKSISDINDNLDEMKGQMGELGKVTEEHLAAQQELHETISAVFKMSDTTFEEMTTKAKTFFTEALTKVIKGLADVCNWFINIYNEAVHVRVCVATLIGTFKALWSVITGLFEVALNGFKSLGGAIEGLMLVMSGKFEEGWNKIKTTVVNGYDNLFGIIKQKGKEIGETFADEYNKAIDARLEPIKTKLEADEDGAKTKTTTDGTGGGGGGGLSDKEKKELEKRAKEELKRLNALEESKINLMEEGHEKELALIRLKFKKKIDEITGNGETEKALRLQLLAEMETELRKCEEKYQQELAKINLDNRLAAAEEGSKAELDLKLAKLEQSRLLEIEAAKKTGADVNLINEKFEKEKLKLKEDYADKWSKKMMEQAARETDAYNNEYMRQVIDLKRKYIQELAAAGDNVDKREEVEERFNRDMAALNQQLAEQTLNTEIGMLREILKNSNLSADERYRIEQTLTEKELQLLDAIAEYHITTNTKTKNSTQKWLDDNLKYINAFGQMAADVFNGINELVSQLYDNQIAKIEELQEANQQAGEREQEYISDLVNKKVISEEEGEARKRAAAAETERKEEELARKKAALQLKQAKWDKANSIAQATISTALAVVNALQTQPFWLGIAMAAVAGAMGAAQIATIAATPLPQYAKGTDYHRGGLAVVGDGGRQEVVMHRGSAWLTPDTPTVVDLPKGASVIPSVDEFTRDLVSIPTIEAVEVKSGHRPYDDRALRREVSQLNQQLRLMMRRQSSENKALQYELFKSKI